MFKLCFFVPDSHLETVKTALFQAGAGRIGHYDQCCWQVLGHGQFRPLPGSDPHIGNTGALERLEEWKVELVVEAHRIQAAVAALKATHPYETPAYEVYRLEAF
jgi:hypothetical protein